MRILCFASSILFLLASCHSESKPSLSSQQLSNLSLLEQQLDLQSEAKGFPVSTEMEISKAYPIVKQANEGLVVSVGGERSFRLASMHEKATGLVVIDISPDIHRFVQINRLLLKAPDRATYRHLRWNATLKEWLAISKSPLSEADFTWWNEHVRNDKELFEPNNPFPEMLNRFEKDLWFDRVKRIVSFIDTLASSTPELAKQKDKLLARSTWDELKLLSQQSLLPFTSEELIWWHENFNVEHSCFSLLKSGAKNAVDVAAIVNFRTMNYIFDDVAYLRLHELAARNLIFSYQIDLADKEQRQKLAANLKTTEVAIALLDLNNLWQEDYLGDKGYRSAMEDILPTLHESSVILSMTNYMHYGCVQFQSYFGFSVEKFRSLGDFSFNGYVKAVPRGVLHFMNGQYFEGAKNLPYGDSWEKALPEDASRYYYR